MFLTQKQDIDEFFQSSLETAMNNLLQTELSALICGLTLGIATPWAVCTMQNWKTKHTLVDGQRLYFDGTGAQLFGNWIKWFLLTIITF